MKEEKKALYIDFIPEYVDDYLMEELEDVMINGKDFGIVGSYETIKEFLNYVMNEGTDYELTSCVLKPPEYDDYDDAYVMAFYGEFGEIEVNKALNTTLNKYSLYSLDKALVEKQYYDKWASVNTNTENIIITFDKEKSADDEKPIANSKIKVCVDDDHKGFCACIDDKGFHSEFTYKGPAPLNSKDISDILHAHGWE